MCARFEYRTLSAKMTLAVSPAVLSGRRPGRQSLRTQAMYSGQSPPDLFLEHFLDLPDLFFDFAGPVFGFAFSL